MPSTYEPIATNTLGVDTATVTFSSIPQTYTDLVLVCNVTRSGSPSGGYFSIRYNSDSATNYSATLLYGDGASAASLRVSNETSGRIGNASGAAGSWSPTIVNIMNYTNTTTFKTSVSRMNATGVYVGSYVTLWRKTPEAINSLSIFNDVGNFYAGSTFTLYGIKAA